MLQIWMISYNKIQKRDPNAAELLLLLAHFDNRDIWYELVKGACGFHNPDIPVWLKQVMSNELTFKTGLKTLIRFSLLETHQQGGSYAMHPVVDWCLYIARAEEVNSIRFNDLALISVGYTVLSTSARRLSSLQQRLIPHANYVTHRGWSSENTAVWGALLGLDNLYLAMAKLSEAEKMYQGALAGFEKALGPDHISTLETINNLGDLYKAQGRSKEALEMYQRALAGFEKAMGPDHISTLDAVKNLGALYSDQGKFKEAEAAARNGEGLASIAKLQAVMDGTQVSVFGTIFTTDDSKLQFIRKICDNEVGV
ncbi:hypothetical protein N7490_006041 [Penicillium lividum]|nr:hypothetical protein N7490_006041 [Penicillium lividum]